MPLDLEIRPLTYELANHVKAYLEAGQYVTGFEFLHTLLTTNTSISVPAPRYHAFLAPVPHLALAATLIAYPNITTKAKSVDQRKGADAALRYLHHVQCAVHPLHGALKRSFTFPEVTERTRRARPANEEEEWSRSVEDDEKLSGLPANAGSIWLRASDFWHAVGWAFNCSVAHRKRWERWKLWLDIMLKFIEADWKAHGKRCEVKELRGVEAEEEMMKSLLWHHICSGTPTSRQSRRRIARAILATATPESMKEFPEVWARETEDFRPKKKETKFKADADIDSDHFGDFLNAAVDGSNSPPPRRSASNTTPGSVRQSRSKSVKSSKSSKSTRSEDNDDDDDKPPAPQPLDDVESLGGMDAIHLRQRLLALLVKVVEKLGDKHITTLVDWCDEVGESYVQLSPAQFSVMLSTSLLPVRTQLSFNANLLMHRTKLNLHYCNIEPQGFDLVERILPLRANGHDSKVNAQVALVIEHIFMYFMNANLLLGVKYNQLQKAIDAGIEARTRPRERSASSSESRSSKERMAEELQAKLLLEASSERLLLLLKIHGSGGKMQERSSREPSSPEKTKAMSPTKRRKLDRVEAERERILESAFPMPPRKRVKREGLLGSDTKHSSPPSSEEEESLRT
ncbi:hypothetical protein M011DRAFT_480203 [Sporormia fimetaria CBS 119925]|uniref:Uncharacterized protein n=1 Tax=Sporormia fimetaria CBS 119925 TaxID=1340428 RepID=A0A6A6V0S2_9PLEO|nr:hypothetical protein M011DRAFT_480203 [Sporormia fimetaria CBS 119925]